MKIIFRIATKKFCTLILTSMLLMTFSLKAQNTTNLNDAGMMKFTKELIRLPFGERDVILKGIQIFERDFASNPQEADWAYQLLQYYHELTTEDKTNTLHIAFGARQVFEYKNKGEVDRGIRSELSRFEKEYANYGYRVMAYEDTGYAIESNPDFLFAKCQKYLSEDYRYYRGKHLQELHQPPYWHAQLVIKLSELMERIRWRDELIDNKKDFVRGDLVGYEIENLMIAVAKGLENTPIYGTDQVILPEYKNAIQTYYRAHTNTRWGLFLTEFMHRLSINKYRHSDAIDQYVMSYMFPEKRKQIDPLQKYKDMLSDNLVE